MKRILITTGIYPPKIGGPAQYAKNLAQAFSHLGYQVRVKSWRKEYYLPWGIRHLFFFLKTLPAMRWAEFCIALDTFSVGWPTVAAGRLFGKRVIIRTGGDFLWEQYVERTGRKVLLRKFYKTERNRFSWKEEIIFRFTRWTLRHAWVLVFSTGWQRRIWQEPYEIDFTKTSIIENYYGKKIPSCRPQSKVFIGATRLLKWKNLDNLRRAFLAAWSRDPSLILDLRQTPHEGFLERMRHCYAVILTSLGDISPNMVLDALRCNRPVILTGETGLREKLKRVALFVNPLDEHDITEKILFLSRPENYELYCRKVEQFNFLHGWEDIAKEFLALNRRI